jgi:hypothetical protein
VPKGTGSRIRGPGSAHRLADSSDSIRSFPHHRHHWGGSNVLDQTIIKRLAFMDGVMFFSQFLADDIKFRSHKPQTATLKPTNYFADQSTLDPIWFDKYEGSFHAISPFQK